MNMVKLEDEKNRLSQVVDEMGLQSWTSQGWSVVLCYQEEFDCGEVNGYAYINGQPSLIQLDEESSIRKLSVELNRAQDAEREANNKVKTLEESLKKSTSEIAQMKRVELAYEETYKTFKTENDKLRKASMAMEETLGKVRRAIGEIRFKELAGEGK